MEKLELHINSEEVKTFGGVYQFFEKYSQDDLSNSGLFCHGNFDNECMSELLFFARENNLHVNTFAFSPDQNDVPYVGKYNLADNYIIPEGCRKLKKNTFSNIDFESLELPSTLQKIHKASINDCNIERVSFAKNSSYEIKDNCIIDILTGQPVLRFKKDDVSVHFTKEETEIWNQSRPNQFNFLISKNWEEKFQVYKNTKGPARKIITCGETPVEELKRVLLQIPDTYGNLKAYASSQYYHIDFAGIRKYMQTMSRVAGFQSVNKMKGPWEDFCNSSYDFGKEDILVYQSNSIIPQTLEILFSPCAAGIELLIPFFQFYHFFTVEELGDIVTCIHFLQEEAFAICTQAIKKQKLNLEKNQDALRMYRQDILNSLTAKQKTPEEIVAEKCDRVKSIAGKNSLLMFVNRYDGKVNFMCTNSNKMKIQLFFTENQILNFSENDFLQMEKEISDFSNKAS